MSTVRELLNNALYLSVADREFSPISKSGAQINAALGRLNEVLEAYKSQVPYLDTKQLNGLNALNNVDFSEINYMQYVLGSVLCPMREVTQETFSKLNLVIGLTSIPDCFFHDKANNKISIYPNAMSESDSFIVGYLPNLAVTNLDDSLPSAITGFYRLFLEYEVAQGLCDIYNVTWSEQKEVSRIKYYTKLVEQNQRQLSPPLKGSISGRRSNVPWMAYLGGIRPV